MFPWASWDRNQLHVFYCKLFWTGAPGIYYLVNLCYWLLSPNVAAVINVSLLVALISPSDLHEWPLGCSFRCWLWFIMLSRALQTCPSGTSNSCSSFAVSEPVSGFMVWLLGTLRSLLHGALSRVCIHLAAKPVTFINDVHSKPESLILAVVWVELSLC